MRSGMTRQALRDFSDTNSVAIIRIVNTQMENSGVMRAFGEIVDSFGRVSTNALRFAREGDEWKPAVTIERNATHEVGAAVFRPQLLPTTQ